MTQKNINTLFLIILIVCAINFFDLQSVKGSFVRYIQFGYILIAIFISAPFVFPKRQGFVLPVQLIVFSVFISVFISTVTREQSFIDSVGGTIPILILNVFFYLKHINYPVNKIEKIVVGYGILYLILYFFQFTHPDTGYFVNLEYVDSSRGILRIVFPGRGLFYLTIFIAINKITSNTKSKWLWVLLASIGIIVTVMQVTRQFIFGAMVIYLIHFLRSFNLFKKIAVSLLFLGIVVYIYQSQNPIVTGLRDTQEQNKEMGADYIRIQAAEFFLTDFSKTSFNRIFGNGVPYGDSSPFMKFTTWNTTNKGYWLSDVGLIAVYAMFGLIAVLGYFLIWIKSFTIQIPKQYYYVKYYLWFLLMTCLTSDTLYSSNDLISTVLALYIYQNIYEKVKIGRTYNSQIVYY